MDDSNQIQETYMDKLNPAVREGIRRSFAELDIQDPDFEEKAESMIEQFLEMQFKDVIKEWKKTDSKSFFRIEPKNRIEVFDKITEEILTELKSVMMQSSEDKALIEDKVSSMERDIKEYNQPIKRILKQQDRRTYDKYLMYKMDQVEEESNKYKEAIDTKIKELTKCKEEIDTKIKEITKNKERIAKVEEEITKNKERIAKVEEEITKNKERIAKVEEEISKLRKQILEEEEFLRIGTEYLETIKEKEQKSIELVEALRKKEQKRIELVEALRKEEQKSIELVEVLRKKEQKDIELVEVLRQQERIVTKQIKFMQIIYNDYLAKLEFIKEELREEAEYFGIPIPETNTGTLEDRKIPEEAEVLGEGDLPEKIEEQEPTITEQEQTLEIKEESTEIDNNEKNGMPENEDVLTEELKTNPLFQKIQDITERAIQAQTPKELFEATAELESMYLKRRNNPEQKNEMDYIMSKISDSRGALKIGEFYMRARKKYIELTGKDNPTEEDKKNIESIREDIETIETFLQERFPDQDVNISPLKTEQEYFEELKSIELEIIKIERNMETKRHFIFGKKGKNQEDEGKIDITEKMMQMYLELSKVTGATKTNNIQRIYNRIIRKLKRMPDIDDSKIPPTLKEMVVQRVETPLPNTRNGDGNIESREIPRTGENTRKGGPSIE